ncbi:6-phospho-beta-galactosidase [Hungatella hathewayi]|uniref:6-phospho-beta-galactosidase n=2 Tax=Lachnospirales TaxID=3085636 RepID=A0A3E2WVU9_9FIRM|nr:6-phospho-beta-galactosidase [Faecalicatena contorta]RGC31858.1 6-phospho-beta-galactosidase [Hungatella hathewayi]
MRMEVYMEDRFKELSAMAMKELTEVFDRMDDSNVRDLLELIKKTDRIFLLAAGREGLSTRSFAMRLMHLGKQSYWIWDDTTPSIGEGDLMICACGSANVGHENYIAKMAKDNGAELALITPSNEGYLLSIADLTVNVPAAAYKATGDFVPTEQLMGNLFEQALFILYDVLVMMLREEMGISKEEMVSRHRNVE